MTIALVSCSNLPGWEKDDRPLHTAFAELGISFDQPAWDSTDVDWSGYDACLIRTTWDYTERQADFVRWAQHADSCSKLFNPARVIAWNSQKTYLKALEEQGIPIAPTVWLEPGAEPDLTQIMADKGWERGFIKPLIGACARETLRFDNNAAGLRDAQEHSERMLREEALMLQPYLTSVEDFGEISAFYFDGAFSHSVRKVPVKGDYRVMDDFGAHDEPYPFKDDDLKLAARVLDVAQRIIPGQDGAPLLYARVDFLLDNNGDTVLTELELVEPSLFFRHKPEAGMDLARALQRRL